MTTHLTQTVDLPTSQTGSTLLTRPSLLLRIRSNSCQHSWSQFTELYCPIIYRFCRRKGLQDADAQEVMQDVLLEIFRYIKSFEYDPDRGRFRGWLCRVIHSRLVRFWKRIKNRSEQTGHSEHLDQLVDQEWLDYELVRQIQTWAIQNTQQCVQPETWDAFRLTWLENLSIEETAKRLKRTRGWVYVARSRVLKRISEQLGDLI